MGQKTIRRNKDDTYFKKGRTFVNSGVIKGLNKGQRGILLVLLAHADDDLRAWPSRLKIARALYGPLRTRKFKDRRTGKEREVEIVPSKLLRDLRDLEERGVIVTEESGGGHNPAITRIVLPPASSVADVREDAGIVVSGAPASSVSDRGHRRFRSRASSATNDRTPVPNPRGNPIPNPKATRGSAGAAGDGGLVTLIVGDLRRLGSKRTEAGLAKFVRLAIRQHGAKRIRKAHDLADNLLAVSQIEQHLARTGDLTEPFLDEPIRSPVGFLYKSIEDPGPLLTRWKEPQRVIDRLVELEPHEYLLDDDADEDEAEAPVTRLDRKPKSKPARAAPAPKVRRRAGPKSYEQLLAEAVAEERATADRQATRPKVARRKRRANAA